MSRNRTLQAPAWVVLALLIVAIPLRAASGQAPEKVDAFELTLNLYEQDYQQGRYADALKTAQQMLRGAGELYEKALKKRAKSVPWPADVCSLSAGDMQRLIDETWKGGPLEKLTPRHDAGAEANGRHVKACRYLMTFALKQIDEAIQSTSALKKSATWEVALPALHGSAMCLEDLALIAQWQQCRR